MKRNLFALSILSLGLTMTAFASIQGSAATCCQDKAACCEKVSACCNHGKCCDKGDACCKESPKPTCCDGKNSASSPAAAPKL